MLITSAVSAPPSAPARMVSTKIRSGTTSTTDHSGSRAKIKRPTIAERQSFATAIQRTRSRACGLFV